MSTAVLDPTAEYPVVDAPAPEPAYTGSGNPRTASTPGRKPGQRNGEGRRTKQASAPPRRSTPTPPKGKAAPDYRPGVKGLLQILAMIPAAFARITRKPKVKAALTADVVAIHMHAGQLAEAAHQTALHDQRLAAALDKILTIGPYGLVIGALLEFGAQVAVNHEALPAGFMGARSRDELLATLDPEPPAAG